MEIIFICVISTEIWHKKGLCYNHDMCLEWHWKLFPPASHFVSELLTYNGYCMEKEFVQEPFIYNEPLKWWMDWALVGHSIKMKSSQNIPFSGICDFAKLMFWNRFKNINCNSVLWCYKVLEFNTHPKTCVLKTSLGIKIVPFW